jgi:hypothetical protein
MGATAFRRALQTYMRQYAYSNANSTQLFACMDRELAVDGARMPLPTDMTLEQVYTLAPVDIHMRSCR